MEILALFIQVPLEFKHCQIVMFTQLLYTTNAMYMDIAPWVGGIDTLFTWTSKVDRSSSSFIYSKFFQNILTGRKGDLNPEGRGNNCSLPLGLAGI